MQKSPENATMAAGSVALDRYKPTRRCRILIAEDAKCVQRSADAIANQLGMDVDMAADGQIACHLAKAARADGKPYDLILMDMQMPNMDGVEAVRWLRQNHWSGPIVAVSVHVGEKNREQFLAAGCDDFIAKPLTAKKMRAMLVRLARRYDGMALMLLATGELDSTRDQTTPLHGRLLVVEDAHCIQLAVASLLQRMGLDVDTADDGQVACEMAMHSQTEGRPYDAILMDVQMPKMNGKQATSWLRDKGWQGPIIAVSVHATDQDHEDFLKAGYDDYLAKPAAESSLRNILSLHLTQEA